MLRCGLDPLRLTRPTKPPSPPSIRSLSFTALHSWRSTPINPNRFWGPKGPQPPTTTTTTPSLPPPTTTPLPSSLSDWASLILSTADPLSKSSLTHLAFSSYLHHPLPISTTTPSPPPHRPARPQSPSLVSHKEVPSPKESKLPLNAYLLHNLAHVELNAIDLAWDTVVRFAPMREALGDGFFEDFARVADDESRHFTWCSQRLAELGFKYGDMPAHDLLWRECERSSGDVGARLAVIPLVQEARGLDAGPRLVQKLIGFGDHRTSNIVAKIAEEEVAHVAVGVFWFMSVCQKMGRVPCVAFRDLLEEFNVELKGPFNYAARDEAGIPRDWY
ncbi:hypothetical protein QJS04_geneDACA008227 [Acorus gramineus]|uniref:Uncharacterized protein n=1 Tax=Acorus gramineus TaxID=55184 RepID=A0AAV9AU62_ACOGR|nr:hypothetical protein QJS04_geneDACA008227 [Acorus gramineus]